MEIHQRNECESSWFMIHQVWQDDRNFNHKTISLSDSSYSITRHLGLKLYLVHMNLFIAASVARDDKSDVHVFLFSIKRWISRGENTFQKVCLKPDQWLHSLLSSPSIHTQCLCTCFKPETHNLFAFRQSSAGVYNCKVLPLSIQLIIYEGCS